MDHNEVVKLENVWADYHGTLALEDINLTIEHNDFLGIIGPNGGGKTTLLKIVLGLLEPSRGRVSVMSKRPRSARGAIGYVPQHSMFDREFPISVWEVALMGRHTHTGLLRRFSAEDRDVARRALDTVGMLERSERQMGKLSGGEQQRVLIARALSSEPELLLLDEPTASVDATMQTQFYDLLDELKQRMAIVLVSHDISALSVHVDKIACLNRQLFHHGSPEIESGVLEATYKCPIQMIGHGDVPHRVLKEH